MENMKRLFNSNLDYQLWKTSFFSRKLWKGFKRRLIMFVHQVREEIEK